MAPGLTTQDQSALKELRERKIQKMAPQIQAQIALPLERIINPQPGDLYYPYTT